MCARAWVSVTKVRQTGSNAKKPERPTVGLRLCLHLGDWVVCSEPDSVPPFFLDECGAAAAQYHPRTPTLLKQFCRFGFKGLMLRLGSDRRSATCVKSVCLDIAGREISSWHNFSALAGRTEEQMFSCLCVHCCFWAHICTQISDAWRTKSQQICL